MAMAIMYIMMFAALIYLYIEARKNLSVKGKIIYLIIGIFCAMGVICTTKFAVDYHILRKYDVENTQTINIKTDSTTISITISNK